MTVARVAAGTLTLALLAGCGSELSNSAWVSQPEAGASPPDAVALAHDDAATPTQSESAPTTGPQRLDHTVTLGAVMVADAAPAPAAPGAGPTSVVIVNVNGYAAPAYTPYGYGYGYGTSFSRAGGGGGNHPSFQGGTSSMQPGQSWPAAASHGPSFPYPLSPASPWENKR